MRPDGPDASPVRGFVRRTRPWIWGYGAVVALFVAGWLTDPIGVGAQTLDPAGQLGSIALLTLPATIVVGVLFAFIPARHRVLRTALLVPLAVYVAGAGALFTFTAAPCTAPCPTTMATRALGLAGQTAVWFGGRVAEEAALAFRLARR